MDRGKKYLLENLCACGGINDIATRQKVGRRIAQPVTEVPGKLILVISDRGFRISAVDKDASKESAIFSASTYYGLGSCREESILNILDR